MERQMASEKPPIQFGILGCAEIARKVSRAITISPNSTLYAISSRSVEKAERFAVKNGLSETVKIYGSYNELLDDPAVDAVYIPLPTTLHLEWAVLAAQKKKHVLLEKPTALDVVELDRILEACRSNGVQFMDGSMWYHHPRTAKMKELLSDPNLFGQVKLIYSSSSYNPSPEYLSNNIRSKSDLDALGALGDAGWYCIGAIMWAMSLEPPTTITTLPSGHAQNSSGVNMTCTASLHWEKQQTTATFYCSFLSHESMDISVSGSNGSLHVEDLIIPYEESSAEFKYTSGAKFVDMHIGWNVREEEVRVELEMPQEAMMIREFSRLVERVKYGGFEPDLSWACVSRMTQCVMDAVRKSAEIGFQPVYML